jgi:16S rRNA (guanine(966)-N(2))-methyltransferase RsmD
VRGVRIRPTAARVREALFSILASRTEGAAVLDLFAGTGALGIEALSRGAARAVFVDRERAACAAIAESLGRTGFSASATVIRGRLPEALAGIEPGFGLIFLDPPYGDDSAEATLVEMAHYLAPGGLVVFEHGSRYNPPERPGALVRRETRAYGDSAVTFYGQES